MCFTGSRDTELGLIWVFDELQGDELEKIFHLVGDIIHGGILRYEGGNCEAKFLY